MRWTAIPVLFLLFVILFTAFCFAGEIPKPVIPEPVQPLQKPSREQQVIITAVGDCTLGSDVNFGYPDTLPAVLAANKGDYSYIFRGVYSVTSADDLTIANLEGVFTTSEDRYPKQYAFKGRPEFAKILTAGSIEVVNLSNNHIYDYYERGFTDTVKALDKEGISWFGEGTAKVQVVRGVRIGLLGYAFEIADEVLAKDIAALKTAADLVIVSFHWGQELAYWPGMNQRKLGRLAIDYGADIVIGHHPHVLQGIEVYKKRLIAYSLGNFAFGGNMNPSDKRTMLLRVQFFLENKMLVKLAVKVIPARVSSVTYVNDYQPSLLTGEERTGFLQWFSTLCGEVELQNGEMILE